MMRWFQVVLAVGILCVSAASLAYLFDTWRTRRLESYALARCEAATPMGTAEHNDQDHASYWLFLRDCANRAVGQRVIDLR